VPGKAGTFTLTIAAKANSRLTTTLVAHGCPNGFDIDDRVMIAADHPVTVLTMKYSFPRLHVLKLSALEHLPVVRSPRSILTTVFPVATIQAIFVLLADFNHFAHQGV
jgi:hypothetical protein